MNTSSTRPRLFAIIPAAGLSRRMGTHKLLLSLGKKTVIQRLLQALDAPFITRVIVVARKGDDQLKEHLSGQDLQILQPETDPPDMKASVQIGLEWVNSHYQPTEKDSWLLIPADHPVFNRSILNSLFQAWENCQSSVMIPTFQNQKGHPTFFRWSVADDVFELADDEGINALWKKKKIIPQYCECQHSEILMDLDTPEDYEKVKQKYL